MASKDHLEKLRDAAGTGEEGINGWNQWRLENEYIRLELGEANLHDLDLSNADLSNVNLYGANLSEANLRDANLTAAILTEANLNHAFLENADFLTANLSRAKLSGANLSQAQLFKANLSNTTLKETDLYQADLTEANLKGANLCKAIISEANLTFADLSEANLSEANLHQANLYHANLSRAKLSRATLSQVKGFETILHGANLEQADLRWVDFEDADLSKATLTNADLSNASLVKTNFKEATLTNCRIYGISAWDLQLDATKQTGLIITPEGEAVLTVDDLEIAQFVYFLLTNKKIRSVIDTVAKKAVLLLGRFTKERKIVLDAIASKLRKMDLLPIIFDFQKPEEQNIIETVKTLAGISKFIIADLSTPRVVPDELRSFVPETLVPVVPIFHPSKREPEIYASFYTLSKTYNWVLEPVKYKSKEHLLKILSEEVIKPAEEKRLELLKIKNQH